MTIYKGKLIEKDDGDALKPEVVTTDSLPSPEHQNLANEETQGGPPIMVTLMARRRRGACANYCLLLSALIVLAMGIMGGLYLYKSLSRRTYEGWCGVRYYEPVDEVESMRQRAQKLYTLDNKYRRRYGQFEERIEIDKTNGNYEFFEIPEFEESSPAIVVHDFEKNLTAIVDKFHYTCFLMPLNRSRIMPPKDQWDLMSKLVSGFYMPDVEIIRESYQVVQPEIPDLREAGYYIWRQCHSHRTYMLEKVPQNTDATEPQARVKRSVGSVGSEGSHAEYQFAIPGGYTYMPVIKISGVGK